MQDIRSYHHKYRIGQSTLCDALAIPRATYYRHTIGVGGIQDNPKVPANKLSQNEQQHVLDLLHSERFRDNTPYEIYFTLLDEGQYYCSIRSMYCLLEQQGESQDRRNQRNHRNAINPELMAERPNEVWS